MDLLQSVRKEGSRGGVNFSWSDVKTSQHRENYLGHSLMAPVGRWQQNKDLSWYAKAEDDAELTPEQRAEREAEARREEMRKVKEAEEDAMARALGLPVPERNANEVPLGMGAEKQREVNRALKEALGDDAANAHEMDNAASSKGGIAKGSRSRKDHDRKRERRPGYDDERDHRGREARTIADGPVTAIDTDSIENARALPLARVQETERDDQGAESGGTLNRHGHLDAPTARKDPEVVRKPIIRDTVGVVIKNRADPVHVLPRTLGDEGRAEETDDWLVCSSSSHPSLTALGEINVLEMFEVSYRIRTRAIRESRKEIAEPPEEHLHLSPHFSGREILSAACNLT